MNRILPERIKRWYKTQSSTQQIQFSLSKIQKNRKSSTKMQHSQRKSILSTTTSLTRRLQDKQIVLSATISKEQTTRQTNGNDKQNRVPTKSRSKIQLKVHQENRHSTSFVDIQNSSSSLIHKDEMKKVKDKAQILPMVKSKKEKENILVVVSDQSVILSSKPTIKDAVNIDDNTPNIRPERERVCDLNESMTN